MRDLLLLIYTFYIFFTTITPGIGQITDSIFIENDSIAFDLEMPAIHIIEGSISLLNDVPGSAVRIDNKSIQKIQAFNGNEVIRRVPGIHIVEEEGVAMRMNIGLRGLDPDRSGRMLIMEDGIPIALNPYAEPQMYYSPSIERMQSIDVLKGSGQILFGPQTIGGVINFITADPPDELSLSSNMKIGEGGLFSGLFSFGNRYGNTALRINYLRKQADQIGPTQFTINDLTSKFRIATGSKSSLGLKIGVYEESSNSTYLGQTQAMYENGSFDFLPLAPHDMLKVNRLSLSAVHQVKFNYKTHLQTTIYHYNTMRNWQRQDFSYSPITSPVNILGLSILTEGLVYMKDSNGHRNREFLVTGVESKLTKRFQTAWVNHKLYTGIRFLFENADEQRINGTTADARSGNIKNDEERIGRAISLYALDKINLGRALYISLGLRAEHYTFERKIWRINYVDTQITSNQSVTKFIPGIGINYNFEGHYVVFGGIHRGFAPPRIKDAISNSGEVYQLEPEWSVNYEVGFRTKFKEGHNFELTTFLMDFSNQVIPVSESSGGEGFGLINGGKTLHRGIELSSSHLLDFSGVATSFYNNISLTESKYNGDRFVNSGSEAINIKSNDTPYSPGFIFNSELDLLWKNIGLRIYYQYTGSQFADELNTLLAPINGRTGKIPSYQLFHTNLRYILRKWNTSLHFSIKNLTNERYIVSRRPQGIRVGLPRFFIFGINWKL